MTGTRQTGRRSDGADVGRSRNTNGWSRTWSRSRSTAVIRLREVQGTLQQPPTDGPVRHTARLVSTDGGNGLGQPVVKALAHSDDRVRVQLVEVALFDDRPLFDAELGQHPLGRRGELQAKVLANVVRLYDLAEQTLPEFRNVGGARAADVAEL